MTRKFAFVVLPLAFALLTSSTAFCRSSLGEGDSGADEFKAAASKERTKRAAAAAHSSHATAPKLHAAKLHDPNPRNDPDVQMGYDANQREHGKGDSVKDSSGTVSGNPGNQNLQPPTNYHPPYYAPKRKPVTVGMPPVGHF